MPTEIRFIGESRADIESQIADWLPGGKGGRPSNAERATRASAAATEGAKTAGGVAAPAAGGTNAKPAGAALTVEDCRKAINAVDEHPKLKRPAAKALLAKYGVTKVPDLDPSVFAAFVAHCKATVGKADGESGASEGSDDGDLG